MNWTDPQKEILSRLWTEGMTANQIANVLGEGVTRNAVIGKAHRLGLCGGDKEGSRSATASASAIADLPSDEDAEAEPATENLGENEPAALIASKPKAPVKTAVTIADLVEGMCRWPAEASASGTFLYCGEPTSDGAPYCVGHCKMAYQPTKPVRRRPDRGSPFQGIVIEAPKA